MGNQLLQCAWLKENKELRKNVNCIPVTADSICYSKTAEKNVLEFSETNVDTKKLHLLVTGKR